MGERAGLNDVEASQGDQLSDAELAQARDWLAETRRGVTEIFDTGKGGAPVPIKWTVESADISPFPNPDNPNTLATNGIWIGGDGIQHGTITIYAPGARSFESVFIRYGHEIGHFFSDSQIIRMGGHESLTRYGEGLLNVYQGGEYTGPRP